MALPKYADINAPVQTNGNRHYKEYGTSDSAGNPGTYHIYYDGSVQFVALQPNIGGMSGAGNNNSIASGAAAAAPPPAPVAPPVQPNGGVQAPDTPTATPQPASAAPPSDNAPSISAGGGHPQASTGTDADGHSWVVNEVPGSSRYGQQYYVENGHDSHNNPGKWHVYRDGTKIFVGGDGNEISVVQSDAPGMTVTAGASSAGGGQNLDGQGGNGGFSGAQPAPAQSNPTGGTPAPDNTYTLTPASVGVATVEAQAAPASAAPPADAQSYTVVQGDTMWDIAQRNGVTLDQLKSLNPQIEDASIIHPGEQINLPGTVAPAADVASSPFPANSTYDTTTTQPQAAEPQKVGTGGWSDGTTTIPPDPTHNVISSPVVQTDPLKINDNKQDS